MLLVAASVASPWAKNNCRSYYWTEPTPVYVTCQPTPVCTYPSTMVCGPVVAEVCEETPTEPVKAEEPVKAVSAEEEETEDETEFVSFGAPAPYRGGDLALDWGVASIGAGTLYPQQPYAVQSGGFFPWGRGVGSSNGDVIYPGSPSTIINNIINNYPQPNPIPEPASILAWGVGLLAIGLLARRRQRMKKATVPAKSERPLR
jgi:hypothetical protein